MPNDKHSGASPIRQLLELDRAVHEPARLAIMVLLSVVEKADFLYLLNETGLSKGNLSSHTAKLEEAGYVAIEKAFVEKIPRTVYQITPEGAEALVTHRQTLHDVLGSIIPNS
jgi:DNA-binding transcriptional ArsR family regulator